MIDIIANREVGCHRAYMAGSKSLPILLCVSYTHVHICIRVSHAHVQCTHMQGVCCHTDMHTFARMLWCIDESAPRRDVYAAARSTSCKLTAFDYTHECTCGCIDVSVPYTVRCIRCVSVTLPQRIVFIFMELSRGVR